MRARTAIVVAMVVATGLAPGVASANGGAYIEFEGSHHEPGEQVTGEVYVSIAGRDRDLLDRGPFYAYLLPGNAFIEEGRPLPDGAIRVGTFTVEPDGTQTELRVTFAVPDVAGDYYQVGLCNDPCTVSGFGETVSGAVSIVATAREGTLLTENGRLHGQVSGLTRDLRKAEKIAEDQAAVASADLAESEASRQALTSQVRTLELDLLAARSDVEASRGPLTNPWGIAAIAFALVALALGFSGWRRGRQVASAGDVAPEGA